MSVYIGIFDNISLALFGLFVLFTFILLLYYWFIFSRVAFRKSAPPNANMAKPPVSVVICARNEYENLRNFLPEILDQEYPEFEVILVNDFSEDDSFFLLKSFQEKYPNFKVINLRENINFFSGKKLALALGIKSAQNEIVLLTDADCRPIGKRWIDSMTGYFDNNTNIVLGYGGYEKLPGLLNALIRFDTITIAMQYMGFALAGMPYMGVGRNLAYKKSFFFKSGGFTSHYKIPSGDDDLFVNGAAKGSQTKVALDKDSFTFSNPKLTFSEWFRQKKRHLSTSRYYKFSHKLILGLYGLSHLWFYLTFIALIIFSSHTNYKWIAAGLFGLKTISYFILHYRINKKFNEPKLFLYSPMFDFIFALLNPIFAISNLFYRGNKWK